MCRPAVEPVLVRRVAEDPGSGCDRWRWGDGDRLRSSRWPWTAARFGGMLVLRTSCPGPGRFLADRGEHRGRHRRPSRQAVKAWPTGPIRGNRSCARAICRARRCGSSSTCGTPRRRRRRTASECSAWLTICWMWKRLVLDLVVRHPDGWGMETVIGHHKTDMVEGQPVLRSKDPEGVMQEMWALFAVYQAICRIIGIAVNAAGIPPARISFPHALAAARTPSRLSPTSGTRPRRIPAEDPHPRLRRPRSPRPRQPAENQKAGDFPARKPGEPSVANVTAESSSTCSTHGR